MRDETGNPFSRAVLTIDSTVAGYTAYDLAQTLAQGEPRILLRSLYADRGILQLDVRRLDGPTLDFVCGRIVEALATPAAMAATPPAPADRSAAAVLTWLD